MPFKMVYKEASKKGRRSLKIHKIYVNEQTNILQVNNTQCYSYKMVKGSIQR